jgi:predicted SAM-dependent methyltransferase
MAPSLGRHLNLGCGERLIPQWTNVDFTAAGPGVVAHDLRTPLPFPGGSFCVVYHSHVLEHLEPSDGRRLLGECHRVLEEGGVLRVVVPDLETKAALYLAKLRDAAESGPGPARHEHAWMAIEILDQMARTRSGGEMLPFMRSGRAAAFVRGRI